MNADIEETQVTVARGLELVAVDKPAESTQEC